MWIRTTLASMLVAIGLGATAQAEDAKPFDLSIVYTGDVAGVVSGSRPHAGRYLDNLDLIADLDLGRLVNWPGASLHAYGLNNAGGAPNDVAGTLQGFNNIEVARPRLRLFELWLQQSFGDRGSIRAGLYNLNSEFYTSESSGLLIAPPFGIGSELAATGPNGPSIFPSTALAARADVKLGGSGYVRAAVFNARAGVPGDPGGVDWGFDDGVLTIAEAGITGDARLSAGAWRYSHRQNDIRDGSLRRAYGAYVLGEQKVYSAPSGAKATLFIRAGVSDGDTTPFKGGWQTGMLITQPFASRPDSAVSIGLQQGLLSDKFRANLREEGVRPARAETGIELTYSDKVHPRVTVQPDIQWIRSVGGDLDARGRWIATLRVQIDLTPSL